MIVFGWACMIMLMLFGLFIIGLCVGPFIIAKIKSFSYKLQAYIEDEKIDIDKRSEERKSREEKKREKHFELANKKLTAKLNKVDKKIKLQNEKLKLVEEFKKQITLENVLPQTTQAKESIKSTSVEPELTVEKHVEEKLTRKPFMVIEETPVVMEEPVEAAMEEYAEDSIIDKNNNQNGNLSDEL